MSDTSIIIYSSSHHTLQSRTNYLFSNINDFIAFCVRLANTSISGPKLKQENAEKSASSGLMLQRLPKLELHHSISATVEINHYYNEGNSASQILPHPIIRSHSAPILHADSSSWRSLHLDNNSSLSLCYQFLTVEEISSKCKTISKLWNTHTRTKLANLHSKFKPKQPNTANSAYFHQVSNSINHLQELDLSHCRKLSAKSLFYASKFADLSILRLNRCANAVNDVSILYITNKLFNLTCLDLYACVHITDQTIFYLSQARFKHKLTELNISQCNRLTNAALFYISSHLTCLKSLNLAGNSNITDSGLKQLKYLGLYRLELDEIKINSAQNALESIARNVNLQHISLSHCIDNSNNAALTILAEKCLFLHTINLKDCQIITDFTISALFQHSSLHKTLKSLNLTRCNLLTDQIFQHLSRCSALETLKLNELNNISDRGVAQLVDCANLAELSLKFCGYLGDSALIELAKLKKLRRLNCWELNRITDIGLACLAVKATSLVELNCCGCRLISDKPLLVMAKNTKVFPQLNTLNVRFCSSISHQSKVLLQAARPNLALLS
jgi:hypothetical protein